MTWPELIACTKKKLSRTEVKVAQLKALLKTFRHAYASGAPTPFEVAAHGARCHCGHLNVQHTGEAGCLMCACRDFHPEHGTLRELGADD
jgi:hypothetical protein